ncbi:MAG: UTP--glucose-1-phosphate uridylyltransferase [Phycisphaeraceae bacterium]|nr:UTP--glucose-1-phosphate uridylyltransferase [Phycisphaeraceae bacterium]
MTTTTTERYASAKEALDAIGQGHVLKFYDELDEAQQNSLLTEIEGVDWPEVAALVESHVLNKPGFAVPESIEPVPWYPYEETPDVRAKYIEARRVGEQLIKDRKVAAFTVAGGQGSRLGWDAPKGTFPATPIRKLPLFACFAEYLHNIYSRFGVTIPWYVMTSPLNHADTVAFFHGNKFFGLEEKNLMFFPQAMFPALDMNTGKVLMASKDAIALSPNGHGGSLKALYTSGAIADMHQRGITQLSYTQVDNPNVRMIDPLFLGLHDLDGAEMSSKMLPKAYPKEKLGVLGLVNGKTSVIEYTNLPDELAEQRDDQGELVFKCGNTATHAIRIDFIEKLNTRPTETGTGGFALPWNRAEKKVAHIDMDTAEPVKPESPNAVKLETFVFDALPLADASVVYETDRVDEFAPIKNADSPEGEEPAKDSAESSKQLQTERAARWLEANRVKVPRKDDGSVDAVIEIPQITAIYPEDLKGKALPSSIEPGSEVLL